MNERIYLSRPDITELEEQAVLAAMKSGWVAPAGPNLEAFEKEMAARIGVEHAVALSSGTAALHLGLLALGVKPGDIVVTSTMTFAATANAIVYTGATPYFIDSDPVTGNMDPGLLRQALGELSSQGTPATAVVPVDLLGKAADYTAIEAISKEFNVPILADAAESLGASHAGRPAGSFGNAAILSFNGNKIMTTSGGGMLLTDDEAIASHVRYLSTQARQPVVHYEHADIGYNYRMSNILAAIGCAQLTRLDEMITRRREWRTRYRQFLDNVPGIEIFGQEDSEDNCWLTSIIVDPHVAPVTAKKIQAELESANIESRPLWKPMHLQPVFETMPGLITGTSEKLFHRGVTLPSGSEMTRTQFAHVLSTLQEKMETA
ncbi:aminotransferase class I/II-fold pyridoxal phosphate-dependent enzyme [Enteractinococcus fodinae]|uniref:dTDP-4-amino-4,6-dideoxygalactose transaminase n=1 Tax=Enteractinococcus fodinae TaxID=684663 RepID=A0ABU2B305_9MICC|nr:aminotransferase class I/II-fold pyridoxal phosphate-dependent enzyme [Enteractinococcus fodinae]MDR7348002.1 dTDP-4-amino-4,6-dideoxygalactose transaminase [Enteractinococcus fodinae]